MVANASRLATLAHKSVEVEDAGSLSITAGASTGTPQGKGSCAQEESGVWMTQQRSPSPACVI